MHTNPLYRYIWGQIIICIILLLSLSSAAPTVAGTIIHNDLISVEHNTYQITTANINTPVTVEAIYGFDFFPTIDRQVTIDVKDKIYLVYTISNKSNTTASVTLETIQPTGWSAKLIHDDNGDGIHQISETTAVTTDVQIAYATTLNFFAELTPISLVSITENIQASLSGGVTASAYTGFNNNFYGGRGDVSVTESIFVVNEKEPPLIIPILPLPETTVSPTVNIILDLTDGETNISRNSVQLTINGQTAIANGVFAPNFSGWGSSFTPSGNGYRVVVDSVTLLPQSTTIPVAVQAADNNGNITTLNYQFYTGASPYSIRIAIYALLHGFYNAKTDTMVSTNVSIELRTTRNIVATPVTVAMQTNGWGSAETTDYADDNYYVYIKHYNHVGVITQDKIPCFGSVTINISEPLALNYATIYQKTSSSPYILNPMVQQAQRPTKWAIKGGESTTNKAATGYQIINGADYQYLTYYWNQWLYDSIADYDGNGMLDTRDNGVWTAGKGTDASID